MNFLRNYRSVTVHSVHSNALRNAQKSCIRMISRRNSRVFCELCSQKTPRGMLPVNSNTDSLLLTPFTVTRFAMHRKTNLLVTSTRSSVHNLAGNS